MGKLMKMDFEYFQIQKRMLQTIRMRKVDKKYRVICLFSMSFSWVTILKLSKKKNFLKIFADLSKKSKSLIAIYIYASERFRYRLSKNGIAYFVITYSFGNKMVLIRRILLNFCQVSIFFDILINHDSDPYSLYHFLKECNENFQRRTCKLL